MARQYRFPWRKAFIIATFSPRNFPSVGTHGNPRVERALSHGNRMITSQSPLKGYLRSPYKTPTADPTSDDCIIRFFRNFLSRTRTPTPPPSSSLERAVTANLLVSLPPVFTRKSSPSSYFIPPPPLFAFAQVGPPSRRPFSR